MFGSVPLFRSQSQSQVLKKKLPFLFQKFHVVIPSLSTFSRNCRIYQVVFPPLYSFSPMHPTKNKSILKRIKHKCLSKGFYNFKLKMFNASKVIAYWNKKAHIWKTTNYTFFVINLLLPLNLWDLKLLFFSFER